MGIRTRFTVADGTTVPYPPLGDAVRRNSGYIDTRGRPELVDDIPEARECVALRQLLRRLALPDAAFVSLGCDLGQHIDRAAGSASRYVAGGYIQICPVRHEDSLDQLRALAKSLERSLTETVGTDRWDLNFELRAVALNFGPEMISTHSVWIWGFAKALSKKKALGSRERLFLAIDACFMADADTRARPATS